MRRLFTVLIIVCVVLSAHADDMFLKALEVYGRDYYKLDVVSEMAFQMEDQMTEEYIDLYIKGHGLSEKVDDVKQDLKRNIEADPVSTIESFDEFYAEKSRAPEKNVRYFRELIDLNMELLVGQRSNSVDLVSFAEKMDRLQEYFDSVELNVPMVRSTTPLREDDKFVVTAGSLNLREEPNTNCNIIEALPRGTVVTRTEDLGTWYRVVLSNGLEGYLHSGYLKRYDENASDDVTPISGKKPYYITMVKGNTPYLVQKDDFLRPGEILVTFDDGPSTNGNSETVLNTMLDHGYRGIFFDLGKCISSNSSRIIKRQVDEGHDAALHGYYHASKSGKSLKFVSVSTMRSDFGRAIDKIFDAGGMRPRFFRAPYGVITREQLPVVENEFGLMPMGWTIDSLDWSTKDPGVLFGKVKNLISRRGKGILLMHDIHSQSSRSFIRIAEWMKDNGYTVVTPDTVLERLGY